MTRLPVHHYVVFLLAVMLSTVPWTSHAAGSSSLFGGQQDFLPVDEALPFSYMEEDGGIWLTWNIAPEHYLYRDRIELSVTGEGVTLGNPEFSRAGIATEDEFFGEVTVFYEPIDVWVPVSWHGNASTAELSVRYQGCAKAGLCYPPQSRKITLSKDGERASPAAAEASGSAGGTTKSNGWDTESAGGLANLLQNQSTLVIAGLFLLLGLGLTFTPCVLPMVPIISSLVSGRTTRSTGQALALSVSYVLGMALTYAAAGVITGLLGASFNLQAQLQSPWVLGIFAALFVLFALSMFNLFDIQLPRFLRDPLNNASHSLTGGRLFSLFGIGAISALVVSPCVSAPLAGSLLYISTTQDALMGGIALFALGLGMGIPLILVAIGGRKYLPSTGHWMNAVKAFYGVMLLAVAIWLVERLVPAWLALMLWGLLVAVSGVQLGAFDAAKAGWERTRKGVGLILFAYGMALLAGSVSGANDPLDPLAPFTAASAASPVGAVASGESHELFERSESEEIIRNNLRQAQQDGQPVILDFYADWCISCKVMERQVFSKPDVVAALQPFRRLQIDMTDNTPGQQALLDELRLFGPPAILFYDAGGEELINARVLGEMDREQFLSHLRERVGPAL
jgi:thiol:disulfide interchange protein DsbD